MIWMLVSCSGWVGRRGWAIAAFVQFPGINFHDVAITILIIRRRSLAPMLPRVTPQVALRARVAAFGSLGLRRPRWTPTLSSSRIGIMRCIGLSRGLEARRLRVGDPRRICRGTYVAPPLLLLIII